MGLSIPSTAVVLADILVDLCRAFLRQALRELVKLLPGQVIIMTINFDQLIEDTPTQPGGRYGTCAPSQPPVPSATPVPRTTSDAEVHERPASLPSVIELLLLAVGLLVLYFVIRKAVHHGIIDADDAREEHERQVRLGEAMRRGEHPDAPTS